MAWNNIQFEFKENLTFYNVSRLSMLLMSNCKFCLCLQFLFVSKKSNKLLCDSLALFTIHVQHNVSESSKRDILTMLTTACDAEGTHLSKRELVDHVFGFLLAGFDVGHLLPSCVYPFEASIIVKI